MTEREKFEKWLNTLDKQVLVTMAAKQARAIEELQAATKAAVSEWIPVSERMPEYGVAVFVVIDGIFKLIPFKRVCFGGVWWWESVISSTCMLYDISDVTHWMPLPELPLKSKDGE